MAPPKGSSAGYIAPAIDRRIERWLLLV